MALSALDDKTKSPTDKELRSVLGPTFAHWNRLKSELSAEFDPLVEKWEHSGAKYGWSLRLIFKTRVVIYLIPQNGFFLAGLVLGDRAFLTAHKAALPPAILETVDAAPKYGEGRGFRIAVRTKGDVEAVRTLAAIKMAH